MGARELEQLARSEQEVGIRRVAEALVAHREGLVEQPSSGRHRPDDVAEKGSPQIVGDDDNHERATGDGKVGAGLEISFDELDAFVAAQILDAAKVAVDGEDVKPALHEPARM